MKLFILSKSSHHLDLFSGLVEYILFSLDVSKEAGLCPGTFPLVGAMWALGIIGNTPALPALHHKRMRGEKPRSFLSPACRSGGYKR